MHSSCLARMEYQLIGKKFTEWKYSRGIWKKSNFYVKSFLSKQYIKIHILMYEEEIPASIPELHLFVDVSGCCLLHVAKIMRNVLVLIGNIFDVGENLVALLILTTEGTNDCEIYC